MLGIMTGAFIGAGIALLFAPKTGHEMREQLGQQYRGLAERVGDTTHNLRETASHLREQGRERVQQLTSQLSDRASSAAERVTSAAERVTTDRPSPADRFPSSAPSV